MVPLPSPSFLPPPLPQCWPQPRHWGGSRPRRRTRRRQLGNGERRRPRWGRRHGLPTRECGGGEERGGGGRERGVTEGGKSRLRFVLLERERENKKREGGSAGRRRTQKKERDAFKKKPSGFGERGKKCGLKRESRAKQARAATATAAVTQMGPPSLAALVRCAINVHACIRHTRPSSTRSSSSCRNPWQKHFAFASIQCCLGAC